MKRDIVVMVNQNLKSDNIVTKKIFKNYSLLKIILFQNAYFI